MLNKRKADFSAVVWGSAGRVGVNPAKVTDDILKETFPRTCSEAELEGADKMLRTGVLLEVKSILRSGDDDSGQLDLASIESTFRPIVSKLSKRRYMVPSLDEQISLSRLIADPVLLDEARKFERRKGEETLAQADILDELYHAVIAARGG